MIYSNHPIALDVASYCYKTLALAGNYVVDAKRLDADGYCYEDGLIEVNESLQSPDFEIAICHEMIHAKQYENGYTCEKEAYENEYILFQQYLEDYR